MSKFHLFAFLLLLSAVVGCASQKDGRNNFFTGKWEIAIADTPEVKFTTNLVRKNGELTGELTDVSNPDGPKLPITKVEEKGNHISIFYAAADSKELTIDLTKVDDNALKGTAYTFDASARRIE